MIKISTSKSVKWKEKKYIEKDTRWQPWWGWKAMPRCKALSPESRISIKLEVAGPPLLWSTFPAAEAQVFVGPPRESEPRSTLVSGKWCSPPNPTSPCFEAGSLTHHSMVPQGLSWTGIRHVLEMSPSTAPDTARGEPGPGVLSGAAGDKIRGWGGSQGDWAGKLRPIHALRALTINYFV